MRMEKTKKTLQGAWKEKVQGTRCKIQGKH